MYYKVKVASLVPTRDGNKDIQIKMISSYNDEGNRIENIKLDDEAINILANGKIMIDENLFSNDT